jgi:hypothetical protein
VEKDEKIVKNLFGQLVVKLDGIDRMLETREFMSGNVSYGACFSFGFSGFYLLPLNFQNGN